MIPEDVDAKTQVDAYGDTLSVYIDSDSLFVTITDNSGKAIVPSGNEAIVTFAPEVAVEIAEKLLTLTRRPTVATPTTILPDESGPWNQAALETALAHGRETVFSYQKETGPGGLIERRRFRPESNYTNRQGKLVYTGWDPDREDVRAFRVDRIVGHVEVK